MAMTSSDRGSAGADRSLTGDPLLAPPTEQRPASTSRPAASTSDRLAGIAAARAAGERARTSVPGTDQRGSRSGAAWKRATHGWARRIHVYTSMVALLMILFFGLTGIVLNHPEWAFGDETETTTVDGTLPFDVMDDAGVVDYLAVSEYLRDTHNVSGSVDDYRADLVTGGSISYENPGYSATATFDLETGAYELTVNQDAFIAVMTDLHTGSGSGGAWGWVIDLSAGFLVLVAISGLTIQFFLRKRRRPALAAAVAGAVVSIGLMFVTLS